MAKGLVFLTPDHKVVGLNPTSSKIQLMTLWCFIAQSPSIITPSCWYCLINVERDGKHQIIIIL